MNHEIDQAFKIDPEVEEFLTDKADLIFGNKKPYGKSDDQSIFFDLDKTMRLYSIKKTGNKRRKSAAVFQLDDEDHLPENPSYQILVNAHKLKQTPFEILYQPMGSGGTKEGHKRKNLSEKIRRAKMMALRHDDNESMENLYDILKQIRTDEPFLVKNKLH